MEEIEQYFIDIKSVYDNITSWKKPKKKIHQRCVSILMIFGFVFLIFSILPIVPLGLFGLIYVGNIEQLHVLNPFRFEVSAKTFFELWGICVVAAFPFAYCCTKLDDKVNVPSKAKPEYSVSAEQLSFIAVYYSYKEVKAYSVSYQDDHIDNALAVLKSAFVNHAVVSDFADIGTVRLESTGDDITISTRKYPQTKIPTNFSLFTHYTGYPGVGRIAAVANEFDLTLAKYPWFNFDPVTVQQVRSFTNVPAKLLNRLAQRQDLTDVLKILESMSKCLYAFLPEHTTHKNEQQLNELRDAGRQHFQLYIESMQRLSEVSIPEPKPAEKLPSAFQKLRVWMRALYQKSLAVRFVAWFILVFALTSCAIYVFSFSFKITGDTMALLVIGTSITAAAVLAVYTGRHDA